MAEVDFTQDTNGDFGENGEKSNGNGEAPKVQLAFFQNVPKWSPGITEIFQTGLLRWL